MWQNAEFKQRSRRKNFYPFITHIDTTTHKHVTQETRKPQFSKVNKKSHFLTGIRALGLRQLFLYISLGNISFFRADAVSKNILDAVAFLRLTENEQSMYLS